MRSPGNVVREYAAKEQFDLSIAETDPEHVLTRYLLFYLIPMWTAAGTVDWYWHRKTDIEHTAGIKESLIHLLMFAEAGAPLVLGLFFEINAGRFRRWLRGLRFTKLRRSGMWPTRRTTER